MIAKTETLRIQVFIQLLGHMVFIRWAKRLFLNLLRAKCTREEAKPAIKHTSVIVKDFLHPTRCKPIIFSELYVFTLQADLCQRCCDNIWRVMARNKSRPSLH